MIPMRTPVEDPRNPVLRRCREAAAGLAAPAAALALWALVLAGVASPLGAALARLDATGRAPPAAPAGLAGRTPCPVPPGALASAAPRRDAERCP
jgi:hypothetical protein